MYLAMAVMVVSKGWWWLFIEYKLATQKPRPLAKKGVTHTRAHARTQSISINAQCIMCYPMGFI